jgi:hypothetical protein
VWVEPRADDDEGARFVIELPVSWTDPTPDDEEDVP